MQYLKERNSIYSNSKCAPSVTALAKLNYSEYVFRRNEFICELISALSISCWLVWKPWQILLNFTVINLT